MRPWRRSKHSAVMEKISNKVVRFKLREPYLFRAAPDRRSHGLNPRETSATTTMRSWRCTTRS
eukprot:9374738-Heterocapsa_arctica.AAC.1